MTQEMSGEQETQRMHKMQKKQGTQKEQKKQRVKEEDHRFSDYTMTLRKYRGISQEQLCEGVCSPTQMTKLEASARQSDQLRRNRLLERLGVTPSDFENMLAKPEYDRWYRRRHIQRAIKERDWERAGSLLEAYRQEYDMENPLERQYYLAMLSQVKKNDGSWRREDLAAAYREAVRLTVPRYGKKKLSELVLSVQELNLILEYARYNAGSDSIAVIREVLDYADSPWMDEINKARLYPKAVYLLWEQLRTATLSAEEYREMDALCDAGIELLRDDQVLYYMWELLGMRQEIGKLTGQMLGQEAGQQTEQLTRQQTGQPDPEKLEEAAQWREAIEEIYQSYGLPAETYEYCYLYEENEVYCIGDVIRLRRGMLGMSRKDLCEGICDIKTLRRLESNATKPQREVARLLLARLKLPTEYYRTELQTARPEARRLMRKLRRACNQFDVEAMGELIGQIEELIPMEDAANRQVMARYRLLQEKYAGEVSGEAYLQRMIEVLEITLPLESVLSDGEKYMTNEELQCIQNLIVYKDMEYSQAQQCIRILTFFYQYFEVQGIVDAYMSMYEMVMNLVASHLGDQGEYEESNNISKRLLQECLQCRRANLVDSCLYNIYWNDMEQQKKNIPHCGVRNKKEELKQYLNWAIMIRDFHGIKFYEQKINNPEE